jgi:hypothetical protein
LPPNAPTIPPRPADFRQILISEPDSGIGFLITNPEIVSSIREKYNNMNLYDCGCGKHHAFFSMPGDEEYLYDVIGFDGGWELRSWHYLNPDIIWGCDVPEEGIKLAELIERAKSNATEVYVYNFLASDPHKHGETMDGINAREGLYTFFRGQLTSQYSSVELRYVYNDKNNIHTDIEHMKESELGNFACDDIFIPIVDYIREKSNLYQISQVRLAVSGGGGFQRRINIFLNYPLSLEESDALHEMWRELLETTEPYSYGSYSYKEVTQYPITVISERALSVEEIEELEQTFLLEFTA